jgi:4-amino-4-deoxy-L-arabinose transferase-like glycosyltransferase
MDSLPVDGTRAGAPGGAVEAVERRLRGWRAPILAALLVLAAALPGLARIPPLDRDEARFAQATAQMLETGDLVNIRFQDAPRDKKPVGIHWLQAASVRLFSSVERREIWAYRLPSIAGAMLAAAACAWGAAGALGARGALAAGAVLGTSFLLSSEAFIAKTDAVLCGAVVLSMAALGRLYLAAREGPPAPRSARVLFWAGQALAILVKGPIGPMVAAGAILVLWIADRRTDWIRRLGWVWGLVLVLAVTGPWAVAITVATDGRFWTEAVAGDLAPKLAGGHETHGAPPGLHLLLSPLLVFPATLLLPAALAWGWRRRREPFARFALAWLVPGWLLFELAPTKLVHYPLPLYGALAWLCAGALSEAAGAWPRRIGAALSLVAGLLLAAAALWAARTYGSPMAGGWAAAGAALAVAAGAAGAWGALKDELGRGLAAAAGLGLAAHAVIVGGLAPALDQLWLSDRTVAALGRAGLDPRNGVTPGPVAVAGYSEPSLVFRLGTETQLGDAATAADALSEGRPAIVEAAQEPALRAALAAEGTRARRVGEVKGYDYSNGDPARLTLWRAERLRSAAPGSGTPPAAPTRR